MNSTLLCLALAATGQTSEAPRDHASLHPAESDYFAQILDLPALGVAYADAPLVKLLRDESLLGFLSEAFGFELDPELVSPTAGFELLLDQLPPDAIAMGVDEMLSDLRSVSISATMADGAEAEFGDFVRSLLTRVEVEQLSAAIRRDLSMAPAGAAPEIARAAEGDPGLAIDPWGNPYGLEEIEDVGAVVVGLGADGARGGEGVDGDVQLPVLLGLTQGLEPDPGILGDVLEQAGALIALEFNSAVTPGQIMAMLVAEAGGAAGEAEGVVVRDFELNGVTYSGLDVEVEEDGVTFGLFVAQNDNLLVLGLAGTDLDDYLVSVSAPTLAADGVYLATQAALPPVSGDVVQSTFTRKSEMGFFIDVFRDALDAGLVEIIVREDPDLGEFAPLAGLLAGFEVDRRPSAARTVLADGRFVSHTFRLGAATASAAFPARAIDRARFAPVGADAAVVLAFDLNLPAAFEGLLDMAAQASGMDRVQLAGELEQMLGTDPRADLLPHLGENLTVALDPIRGIGAPKLMGYLDLQDPERAAAGLERLFAGVAQASQGALSATLKPYRKMPLVRMDIADFGFVEPSAGIVGDRLVMGLSGVHVKKELRRLGGDDLAAHPVQDPDLVHLPAGTTSFAYVDWGGIVGAAWDAGRALASLAGGFVDELPFDPSTLPAGSLFTDHLPPMVRTVNPVPGGELTTTIKPLGPEGWLIPQLALGAVGIVMPQVVESEQVYPVEESWAEDSWTAEDVDGVARLDTDRALIELRTALEIYYLETGGRYPADLATLSEPTENFPRGTLDGEPIPNDGWGNAFAYSVIADGAGYTLWSFGPDGVDEGGRGDDVAVDEN